MKLFIWNNPYHVAWGGSLLYVVANDLKQAKELAAKGAGVSNYGYDPEIKLTIKNLGEPTRIVNLPCAEVYEWSE